MSDYTDAYVDLLIKQYWEQPNARAEIELLVGEIEPIRDAVRDWPSIFDLDVATADRLDIIGRIIGLGRRVPFVVPKVAFGFAENPDGRGFCDKFIPIVTSAPFQDRFQPAYTALELADNEYRFYLKAKAARNAGSAFMVSDTEISVQDVINTAFDGQAYVIDKKDMTLVLYVSPAFDLVTLAAIQQLGLLPKPQGVRYSIVVQAAPGETFGFADNPNALGFSDKFNPVDIGGRFALKVI